MNRTLFALECPHKSPAWGRFKIRPPPYRITHRAGSRWRSLKKPCQGSRSRNSSRLRRLPTVKWSDRNRSDSSSHASGVETEAWGAVDRVVTMSEKDRKVVPGSVSIPNGVDLDRFQPSFRAPEDRRLLFIGSFAHPPNDRRQKRDPACDWARSRARIPADLG